MGENRISMLEPWTTPNSGNIAGGTYDPDLRQATIEFRSGGVYTYNSIDRSVIDEMIASPSPGQYFQRHIKGKYSYAKN